MMRHFLLLLVVVTLVGAPAHASAAPNQTPPDPGLPGPYATDQFNFTLGATGATVFYPGANGVVAAGGPFAGLVLGHGFARSRSNHSANGVFLASHGFIVVTVDFPNPTAPDYTVWAAKISAALTWLETENVNPASRFYGHIATNQFGVLGHSAGGMAAWVAAGQDNRIKAIMPLDPVPASGADLNALGAGLTMPSGWAAAPPSSCNASASYTQVYPLTAAAQRAQYVVTNATHCDFEDPTDFLCTLACGSSSSTRRQIIRRYAVAWLQYYLVGDTDYYYYIHGDGLASDLAAGRLTNVTARNTQPQAAQVQAAANGGAAQLTWQPYPVAPLAGYSVYRRRLPDPAPVRVATLGLVGAYLDSGLPAGNYEYSLVTRDTADQEHQRVTLAALSVACYRLDVAPEACDGAVNLADVQAVAAAWPSVNGQPGGYSARLDVDGDQMITIADVQQVAAAFGWPGS